MDNTSNISNTGNTKNAQDTRPESPRGGAPLSWESPYPGDWGRNIPNDWEKIPNEWGEIPNEWEKIPSDWGEISESRPGFVLYSQTYEETREEWRVPSVLFVLNTNDEKIKEETLTREAKDLEEWTLVERERDSRLLVSKENERRYRRIFAIPTIIRDK